MVTKIEVKEASESPVKKIIESGNLVSCGKTVVLVLENNPEFEPDSEHWFTGIVLKSDVWDAFTVHNDFSSESFEQFVGTVNLVGVP